MGILVVPSFLSKKVSSIRMNIVRTEESRTFGSVDKKSVYDFAFRIINRKVDEISVYISVKFFFWISNIFRLLTGKSETSRPSDSVVSGKLVVISRFRGYFDHGEDR